MGWLPIATLGEMKFTLPSAQWLGALLSALVGVIWFVVAKWIWDLNESGRLFILVIAVVNLIVLVLAILGATSFSAVALQVIVNVLALVLALLPSTEAAFRGRP
jgi:FlaA1/EpsC-like NDP-sugar epimerase